MRRLLLAAAFVPALAIGQTVGPSAQMMWDYPDPMPSHVDGFRMRCNGAQVYEGTDKLIDLPVTAAGDYGCFVVAYNASGESEASNTVNFTFVNTPPTAPSLLRLVQP